MPRYPQATPNYMDPTSRGFTTWVYDPVSSAASGVPANGAIQLSLFNHPGGVISNLWITTIAPMVTPVAGQSFAGLYLPSGAKSLLASTAALDSILTVSGVVQLPLVTPVALPAGQYYSAILQNSSATNANLKRIGSDTSTEIAGTPGFNLPRGATGDVGQTSLPASLGAITNNSGVVYWFGFS